MKWYVLEVWFSGTVQGVGFRYTVMHLAKGFDVVGEVKNLADGRVYLKAQGIESELRAFKEAIEEEMEGYIKKNEFKLIPLTQKSYSGFSITYESHV